MAEPDPERQLEEQPPASDGGDEEEASSPFDHPAFLPVLLWGLAIWFGWDGWFNPEIKSIMFNRVTFGVLVVLGIYFTVQSLREARTRDREGPSA
jgi:hypothetical protein